MSQENVEIAKRGLDAFNRRDLDAYDDLITLDFEWFPPFPGTLEGESYRGREGVERYLEEINGAWEAFHAVAHEYRDLGDRALLLGRFEGRGKGSGVPVDAPLGAVSDFRDGKCSRSRVYLNHGEALRAAGLSE